MNRKKPERKCERIKLLVEKFSGINNIGAKSNSANIPDLKKIYCKLCKMYTDASYQVIATTLRPGYNHASAMNCVKKFNDLFQIDQLHNIDVFYSVSKTLNKDYKKTNNEKDYELINKYTTFLNWFRKEVNENTPIETSFFVGKYFSITV